MTVYKPMEDSLDTFEASRTTLTPSNIGRIDHLETITMGDKYGIFLQTYFVAPQTGDYVFYSSSDDQARIYLSSNENQSQKQLIIYQQSANTNYQE